MTEINKTVIIPEDGNLEFGVGNITGDINYIMFNVVEAIKIQVFLENNDHVVLYENESITGKHYLPVRVRPVDEKGEGYTGGAFVKYKINDNVKIIVSGRAGVQVEFWLNFTPDES